MTLVRHSEGGKSGLGILALQHHDHASDGYQLEARAKILITRVVGRRDKRLQLGQWKLEKDSTGDLLGAMIWPNTQKRKIPAGAFLFQVATTLEQPQRRPNPRRVDGRDLGGERFHMVPLREEVRSRDDGLDSLPTGYPTRSGQRIWPRMPARDFIGIAVAGTNANEQVQYFAPTDPRQIAANVKGDPEVGSWVCDLLGDSSIDLTRTASLQTHERVIKRPSCTIASFGGRNAVAWQIGQTGLGEAHSGGAYEETTRRVGLPSHIQTGLFHHVCRQHIAGRHADGTIIPLHGNIATLWSNGAEVDGPMRYDGPDIDAPKAPHRVRVRFVWDQSIPHQWAGGNGAGKLIWYSYTHKYIPWVPWEPPTDKPPTRTPPDVPVPREGLGGGIPGGGGGRVGEPVQPGGDGVPGSGPLQPFPVGPPPTSGEEGLVELPLGLGRDLLDPQRSWQGWNDSNTWSVAPTTSRNAVRLPIPRRDFGQNVRHWQTGDRPGAASAEILPTYLSEIVFRAMPWAVDAVDVRHPRNDEITDDAQRAIDTQAPAVVRLVALAAQNGNEFTKTIERGRRSPHPGGSANGVLAVLAPERDLADYRVGSKPSRTTSTSYLALMEDVCFAMAGGLSAAGVPIDGMRSALEGSAGKRNLRDQWFNASGTQRAGYRLVDGVLLGGNTGSMIGLGKHTDTQVTGTGTKSLTVGSSTQVQYLACKEGSGSAYTYTIYLLTSDAESTGCKEGSTFNLNLNLEQHATYQTTVEIHNGLTGGAIATITSSNTGDTLRDVVTHFDGTDWRIKLLAQTLVAGLAVA